MTKEVNQDKPRAYECTFYADPEEPFLSFEPINSGTNIPLYTKPEPKQNEPVIKETASAHMTKLLMKFVDVAMMFPTQKPDSCVWEKVLIFAPKQEQNKPLSMWESVKLYNEITKQKTENNT